MTEKGFLRTEGRGSDTMRRLCWTSLYDEVDRPGPTAAAAMFFVLN